MLGLGRSALGCVSWELVLALGTHIAAVSWDVGAGGGTGDVLLQSSPGDAVPASHHGSPIGNLSAPLCSRALMLGRTWGGFVIEALQKGPRHCCISFISISH